MRNTIDNLSKKATPPPPERLGVQVIGEFVQARPQTMADKDDRSLNVAAGKYPVVGAVDRDGQVKSAGIIFDAVDPQSGKLKNVVEFRQPAELAKMARSGKLELAEGIVMSMLGVAQEREREQKQTRKHGMRV